MKRKDFLKFAFITDTHIDNKYGNRIDNTIDSILSKIKQSYEIAEKEKCEFIIHGGDVFNRVSIKEKKEEVFLRLRHIITSSKLKTYFIFGQHDINYSKETYNNSSLKLLAGSCDGKMQLIDGKIEFDNCIIYSSHVYDDIEKIVYNILPCNKPTIVIAHCLLYDKKSFFDTIDVARIALKSKNVNLILSGDLHCGFPFQKHENTWFYNPGSLLRKSIDQKDRKPKLAIITINPFFDDWDTGGDRCSCYGSRRAVPAGAGNLVFKSVCRCAGRWLADRAIPVCDRFRRLFWKRTGQQCPEARDDTGSAE